MRSSRLIVLMAFGALALQIGPALASSTVPDTVVYALSHESSYETGCFGPCACPVLERNPVLGSFKLSRLDPDPLFENYAVNDVKWTVSGEPALSLTGSGSYRRGGEVALQEQLTLDLSINGGAPRHFDSGLVTPQADFPEIHVRVALHSPQCIDTQIVVIAKPLGAASTDRAEAVTLFTPWPNPFQASTRIEFSLPYDGPVDLRVFDVHGRERRVFARGEVMAAGRHDQAWDGHGSDGRVVPPGVYLIRLRTPAGTIVRSVIKIR
jgi:hypothetical protein